MHLLPLSLLCCVSFAFNDVASAMRLGLHGRRHDDRLVRRGNLFGQSTLNDSSDFSYYTNITLGGQSFSVQIDTGSSDLWVAGTGVNSTKTGKTAGVQYVIGEVKGPVETGTLEFAGYTVSNQAFILVAPSDDNPAGTGLIGLGPNNGSQVFKALSLKESGDAVLDRLFRTNTSTPNYLTVLLGRDDDPQNMFPGDLSVGEIIPGYESITDQAKLNVTQVSIFDTGDQHWQTLLDANGVLVNGNPVSVKTTVNSTSNKAQLTAVFDTGFSLPQVPKAVASAIYSKLDGAKLENITDVGETWVVPCDTEANLTIKFGGKSIPIHPLDLTLPALDDGSCIGTFQPISDGAESPFYDMILGMAFLRNVYMLIDFGDFVDGSTSSVAPPYIQFLSTTNDTAKASSDFARVRSSSKETSSGNDNTSRRTIALIVAGVLILLGLILAGISACLRRRRMNRTAPSTLGGGPGAPGGFFNKNPYTPLTAPAPPMAMEVMGGTAPPPRHPSMPPAYGEPYRGEPYHNPYEPPAGPPPGHYGGGMY